MDPNAPGACSGAPYRLARSRSELRLGLRGLEHLSGSRDVRAGLLAVGAMHGAAWHVGGAAARPASEFEERLPDLQHLADEIGLDRSLALWHGASGLPLASCDAMRIFVRGAEEWRAWTTLCGYPTPLWLVPGMPLAEVHAWSLGRVGEGIPGLLGPGVSRERFPYDVAGVVHDLRANGRPGSWCKHH